MTDLASAADALDVIVNEGEGMPGSIFEDDVLPEELAHYFRFEQLSCGRRYVRGDTPSSGPTGPPILLDYDSVLPMRPSGIFVTTSASRMRTSLRRSTSCTAARKESGG